MTGTLPAQSQADAMTTAFDSEMLRAFTVSELTYGGVVESRRLSDSLVLVTVKMQVGSDTEPRMIAVKLRSVGMHWQVVAIQDLPGLLTQLGNEL